MTEELAWAAGLFDGEGTIGVRKNGTTEAYRRIGASVGMTERFVVERFAKAVGIGKFYDHSYKQSKYPNAKPVWRWAVHNFEDTKTMVERLWPWLSEPKRAQARKALDAYAAYPHRRPRARRM